MAIYPPTTTLNYGFVLFKQKQIQALYSALSTWLSTLPPPAAPPAAPTGDSKSEHEHEPEHEPEFEERWEDAKGLTYASNPQIAKRRGDEYNLVEYFLYKSGFGLDKAQVQVKHEKFYADDEVEVGSPEEEGKKLKAIGIVYFPDDHREERLIRKDATDEECGYTSIEFVPLGEAYFAKARERLNAFLNDPVIQSAKLKVNLGMVSSMETILGR